MYRIYDAFISYRRQEDDGAPLGSDIAHAIYAYLTGKGLRVFLDVENMEAGRFDEQLEWQVTRAPNYIFVATPAAMRFRNLTPPDVDYVEGELKLALKLYNEDKTGDKALLPVVPHGVRVPLDSDTSYPPQTHELFKHNVPTYLYSDIPTAKELQLIFEKVTEVKRRNLWNAGQRWLEDSTKEGHRFANLQINKTILPLASKQNKTNDFLPIHAHLEEKPDEPLMDMIAKTKGHLYLIGEGGIGKTTALYSIMRDTYGPSANESDIDRNRYNGQVPLFIELSRAPDTYGKLYYGGRSTFIQRAVYQQIRTDLKVKQVSAAAIEDINEVFNLDPEEAVVPIRDLFTQQTSAPEYLLLLDGLNEVSRTEITYELREGAGKIKSGISSVVTMILGEIHELMVNCPNVRIILTSRSQELIDPGATVTHLYLSGINEKTIKFFLNDRAYAVLGNARLMEILRIPLFLTMYAAMTSDAEILSRGEILSLFFHQKKNALYNQRQRGDAIETGVKNAAAANQPERLTAHMLCFILDFILPKIAWNMVLAESFQIELFNTKNQVGLNDIILHILNDTTATDVCGSYGKLAFTDYLSSTNPKQNTRRTAKLLVKALSGNETDEDDADEELVGNVLGYIVMTLGIMRTDGRTYSFIHHHIRDYFAAVHQINNLRIALEAYTAGDNEIARLCLSEWKDRPLPAMIRQFIGEALGEAHNTPICDKKGIWHYNVPIEPCERNLIKRAFDIFRGRFNGQDGYSLWNLIAVLKDTRVELCGEDFSELDLTHCEINGYSLGRYGCFAKFNGAKTNEDFFLPKGHSRTVRSAVYSPDERRIVTASWDCTAKVWDAETLQVIGTLEGHTGIVNSAAYSPDGHRIVTASWDKTAKIWDADTLQLVGTLKESTRELNSAVYSPDGCRIITASLDKTAKVWDADTLRVIGTLKGHTNYVESAVFSPDGRKIVTASDDKTAKVWDATTLQVIGTLNGDICSVNSAVFSPDGRKIVTSSGMIWDAETLQVVGMLDRSLYRFYTIVYNPDGYRIVGASESNTAIVWDAETLREIGTLNGHIYEVLSAAYSLDGRRIVTASRDKTAKVWDAKTLQLIGTLEGHTREFNSAEYSPDGRRIVTTSCDNAAKVWDANTPRLIGTLNGHTDNVVSAVYSPDGSRIVTASYDNTAKIWDAETLQLIGTTGSVNSAEFSSFSVTDKSLGSDHVLFATFNPDGSKIVTASYDGTAKIWDSETLQLIGTIKAYTSYVISTAYSPDGHRIVTASWDTNCAKVWDVETLQLIGTLEGHDGAVSSVTYSPDGSRIMATSWDRTAKIWDTETLQLVGTLEGHLDFVNSATYNPNGRRIVTVSNDKTAKVWDADTLLVIGTLEGHTDGVVSVAFSPDGQRIITASTDGTARIWDAETFECLHIIYSIPGLELIGIELRQLHPDSRFSAETRELLYEYGAIVDERG